MRLAIAGAGIAGLTLALALARHGFSATLLEAQATPGEAGAGVQLSPNATRRLAALGLLDAVAALAVRPAHVRIRRARDGSDLAVMPLANTAETRYGAPFLLVHRADLHALLLDAVRAESRLALETGVRIDGATVGTDGLILTEGGGGRRVVDGLIGTDGIHSRVRALIAPDDTIVFSGRTAWRSLVPAEAAPPHARVAASNLWLGPGAHLVHYPVRGGRLVNVVAIVGDRQRDAASASDWAASGDPARLAVAFASWSKEARALLAAAPDWRVWPLCDRPPLTRWSSGAVTLAGDAAHPMLPFLAQGAAQAIEDAAALAEALGVNRSSFPDAASSYERTRRDKAARVQRDSRRQASIYHLRGPASLARDVAFRVLGPARMLSRYDWLYGT